MYVKKCDIELLESKLNVSKLEKARLEDEIKGLKQKNVDLENSLEKFRKEGEEKFQELMIENSVLECEKKKAESEVKAWKAKCNEFETRILELQKQMQPEKVKKEIDFMETDSANMNEVNNDKGPRMRTRHRNVGSETGKQSDGNLNRSKTRKKRVTNRVTNNRDVLVDPVDITDNNDNQNRSKIKKKRVTNRVASDSDDPVDISDSKDKPNDSKIKKKRVTNRVTSGSESDDPFDPVDPIDISFSENNQNRSKIKKKRVTNRVTSDSESDDPAETSVRGDNLNPSKTRKRKGNNRVICDSESDDDVPLSQLWSRNLPAHDVDTELTSSMNDSFDENLNKSTRRRRLIKGGNKSSEVSKFMNEVDNDDEKEEDDQETDSSDEFIVDDSDASEDHSASNSKEISENDGVSSGEPQNESENSMDYRELMSSLRREKKQKGDWEYQTDMLAEFGKNSELCMEAVCAMCRHHEENWEIKGEGFNKFDRDICYKLALFMTNGHLDGEVKKTVKELEKFKLGGTELESEGFSGTELESESISGTELESEGFSGTEMCRHYALKYSRQLFKIYKSEQDPYFHFDHLVRILNKNM